MVSFVGHPCYQMVSSSSTPATKWYLPKPPLLPYGHPCYHMVTPTTKWYLPNPPLLPKGHPYYQMVSSSSTLATIWSPPMVTPATRWYPPHPPLQPNGHPCYHTVSSSTPATNWSPLLPYGHLRSGPTRQGKGSLLRRGHEEEYRVRAIKGRG